MNTIDRLVDWFLHSPIYKDGAYLAYYSAHGKGQIYPEITAYAISLCCILYKRRKESKFLERAERCAEYMIKISKNGAVPCFSDNLLYAFDTGIFISSVFDLYALTKKEVYLKEAEISLNWLYSLWDGKQSAAVDKVPENKYWYHIPSVHLAKLAIPLLKASAHFENSECEKTAFKLLDKYRRLQLKNGSFQVNEEDRVVMSHPHCYATEAFLYAYHHSKREEYLEVAQKASDWLSNFQNEDGSLYRIYPVEKRTLEQSKREKTSDATAQATRIWKLLGVNQSGVEKAYNYLGMQMQDNGLRLFRNDSFISKVLDWKREVYSWPTFFYLHSLILPFGQMEYCEELF